MTSPILPTLLREHRELIITRFVTEVERESLAPPGISRSLLVDHIPKVLDELVAELTLHSSAEAAQEAARAGKVARQHGEQRWHLGYDLQTVVREYGVLRHCVVLAAEETQSELTMRDLDALGEHLNRGVVEATKEYVKFRDEQLRVQRGHVEFLADAGRLLSSSLDYRSTLAQLTGLIVPRLADWCAVHLEGQAIEKMPIAHIDPSKVEVLRAIYERFPPPNDAVPGYPRVIRSGESQLVTHLEPGVFEANTRNGEHLDLVRSLSPRSWMIVPLTIQGHTFGALTFGYGSSGRNFSEEDLALAEELARRAAVAIDNAKLFDLSQAERSRAEAATRAKDEFVAMVSHELRTPLNAILGWLRLMQGGSFPDDKREHALDVIERNARAQDRLVADLLDISRIMTGKIRINPTQVDLSNVVEMAMEGLRPAAEAKRIAMEVHSGSGHVLMHGDSDRLQQVVWNLVANAVKFTPKNGRVVVRLRHVESDVELVVEDNGEGIAPNLVPHVFGNFFQSDTSTSRPHGGLGVGLSIVKHIVELHGGSVEAQSNGIGRGATFRVRLPIGPLISTTLGVGRVPATQPAPFVTDPQPKAPGLKVLVVDDDPDARDLIAYLFESAGMEVRPAGSAEEALIELETYTPHVIVSDIGMPGGDGYGLIRRIRTLTAADKKDIPAIALTAFARNEDRTRALVEGFNMHMSKPVEPTALLNAAVSLAGSVRESQLVERVRPRE